MDLSTIWLLLTFVSCFIYVLFYQTYGDGKTMGKDFVASPIGLSFAIKHTRLLLALVAIILFWSTLFGALSVFLGARTG